MNDRVRFCGSLLGLACGDAVGTTVEFRPRGTFEPVKDMVGGGPFRLKPGEWTDDTSMALCLAASLTELGRFDPADQIRRYCRWRDEGYMSSTGRCFDIGNTVSSALRRFEQTGEPFSGSTDVRSAGNGCIMRLAPVSMFYFPDREAAVRMSGESSRTTHGAAECVEASQLFGAILFDALAGKEKGQILFHHGVDNLVTSNLRSIARGDYRSKTEPEIKSSGYVVHCLEAALWCFWNSNDFPEAILKAVNLGDDADTAGAVCGQLAGAYYGESGIPAFWRQRIARSDEIANLAIRLLQSRAKVCTLEQIDSQKSSA